MSGAARIALLIVAATLIGGCNVARWLSTPLWPDADQREVEAQYTDLAGRSVAVMVAANDHTLYRYPTAPEEVSRAISQRFTENLPEAVLMNPRQIIEYQNDNPYWNAIPYGRLIEAMGVDRIVMIELIEYQTHEPGNAHLWSGVISGNVGVISAEAADPDGFVFYTTVRAQFPESGGIGVVDADDQSIRVGMLTIFSRDAAGLFYDHTVITERNTVVRQ